MLIGHGGGASVKMPGRQTLKQTDATDQCRVLLGRYPGARKGLFSTPTPHGERAGLSLVLFGSNPALLGRPGSAKQAHTDQ